MQETQVHCLGGEDLPEKEMASHSSILVWRIPWTEELDLEFKLLLPLNILIYFIYYVIFIY